MQPLSADTFRSAIRPLQGAVYSSQHPAFGRFRFGYSKLSYPSFVSPSILLWPGYAELSKDIRYAPNRPRELKIYTHPPPPPSTFLWLYLVHYMVY